MTNTLTEHAVIVAARRIGEFYGIPAGDIIEGRNEDEFFARIDIPRVPVSIIVSELDEDSVRIMVAELNESKTHYNCRTIVVNGLKDLEDKLYILY